MRIEVPSVLALLVFGCMDVLKGHMGLFSMTPTTFPESYSEGSYRLANHVWSNLATLCPVADEAGPAGKTAMVVLDLRRADVVPL